MKRILKVAAIAAAVALCSCGNTAQGEKAAGFEPFKPTGEKIESAIFGRSADFCALLPDENAAPPISSAEIKDTLEIGGRIYFLADGGVYYLNLETAEAGKLFETSAEMFSTDGEEILTYSPESGLLCGYSPGGEKIFEENIPLKSEDVSVAGLYAAESRLDFICEDRSGEFLAERHEIYDLESFEKVGSFSEKLARTQAVRVYGRYKGDKLIKIEDSQSDSRYVDICEFDLEAGKTRRLAAARTDPLSDFDFSYNPKTDSVILLSKIGEKLELSEHSLTDPDNIVLKRFYLSSADEGRVFAEAYENIVSVICGEEYLFFDFLNPPERIVVAGGNPESLMPAIERFEKETGIAVGTVDYGTDATRLDLKLMAGDSDFDIFIPAYYHQQKYFLSGFFEDLSQYGGLKSRLEGDIAAGFVSRFGEKYVGVPTYIGGYFAEDYEPTAIEISRIKYLAENVDLVGGKFYDPDGKELYKLLKFIYSGGEGSPPFGEELKILSNEFAVINPSGENKESAAKFLEYLFDFCDGDSGRYIEITSAEGYKAQWRFFAVDYVQPILEACNKISQCDGGSGTIKKIAREAAAEVKMRLEE